MGGIVYCGEDVWAQQQREVCHKLEAYFLMKKCLYNTLKKSHQISPANDDQDD